MEKLRTNSNGKNMMATTEFSLVLILVALFLMFTFSTDSFLTEYNLGNVLKQAAITGIIAVASTIVIIAGGIDLSVGSMTGLSSLVVAMMMSGTGLPVPIIILAAVGSGALVGLYNGIIIKEARIAPFIATLGSQIIVRGIVKLISDAKTIVGVYPDFASFADAKIVFGIPWMAIVWLLVALVIGLVIKYTDFGRNIFVIGCSESVAKLSGINIRKNVYGVYMMSGVLCGIAGILLTARINSAIPTGGSGYEMDAIAAAVIGGASLAGGRGSIFGTLLGTLLMVLINNGGIQLGINTFVLEIITGVLITVAVIIDMLRLKKKNA